MKLKKFNQFINEDLDPEELDELELQGEFGEEDEYDSVEDFKNELGEEELGEDDYDLSDEDEDEFSEDESSEEELSDEFNDEEDFQSEEEEEAHEYKGTLLMQELAEKLGTEVTNNQINYDGKVINYYSETEKFHIGKEKFSTIEEVLEYLKPQDVESSTEVTSEVPEVTEEEPVLGESRRYIKRF